MNQTKIMKCKVHGDTIFSKRKDGRYRCRKCSVDSVTKRRRVVKKKLIDLFEGKCHICGYDKYQGALDFHHIDPEVKDFAISRSGISRAFNKVIKEASKCILVCNRCHSEIHGGIINIEDFSITLPDLTELYEKKQKKKQKTEYCLTCGQPISKGTKNKLCKDCFDKSKRIVQRPSLEILLEDVKKMGFKDTGRKYGVSDNSIRKWIKNYKRGE